MDKRVAAIDLGTNTFHVLIAEKNKKKGFTEIYRKRYWVSLAEYGIEFFNDEVVSRAMEAVVDIAGTLEEFSVHAWKVTGTEAFRVSKNGKELLDKMAREAGMAVEILSGEQEAYYIYKGTSLIIPPSHDEVLIMDIGGGSTEFIWYDLAGVKWSKSFPAGVTHLFNNYVNTDPMSDLEESRLRADLVKLLVDIPEELHQSSSLQLAGASGSFEVLQQMIAGQVFHDRCFSLEQKKFANVYAEIRPTTMAERLAHPGIPDNRAKLIVVAFVLIDIIIEKLDIKHIKVSPYALKEGVIRELLNLD